MDDPIASESGNDARGYERSDASASMLAKVGIVLALSLVCIFVGILVLFRVFSYVEPLLFDQEPHALAQTRQPGEGPRLQLDPPQQKIDMKATEDHVLTTYDWVDREQGLVRIPIDRAIAILVKQGRLPQKTDSTEVEQ
ncbi:MAG TPA: hypothetical protein DIC52_21470 [Candidatus Latescibacteria bacterium]|nr:hypothetical protein [Candidatus Latescibacterota bacterium]